MLLKCLLWWGAGLVVVIVPAITMSRTIESSTAENQTSASPAWCGPAAAVWTGVCFLVFSVILWGAR